MPRSKFTGYFFDMNPIYDATEHPEQPYARRIVVSDVHGCLHEFRELIENHVRLEITTDLLILNGDLIDRGPDSLGVLEYVLELQRTGYHVLPVLGNHEAWVRDLHDQQRWESLRLMAARYRSSSLLTAVTGQLLPEVRTFIDGCYRFVRFPDWYCVHAGFNFQNPDPEYDPFSDEDALYWMRDFTATPEQTGGRRVVIGHTPRRLLELIENLNQLKTGAAWVVNIDTGCVFGRQLSALNLDTLEHWQVSRHQPT
jgi:serine/threonine protein phosphatase 1